MAAIIWAILCGVLALACIIIAILQFKEKGFLFNNVYIWASKEEREALDKKPHYRQSGICFLCFAGVFFFMGFECILRTNWLWVAVIALSVVGLIYAIASPQKKQ